MKNLQPRPQGTYAVTLALLAGTIVPAYAQPAALPTAPIEAIEAPAQQASAPTPNSNSAPTTSSDTSTPTAAQQPEVEPPGGNRVLGVLPNYRTADKSLEGTTISGKQKMIIAAKDSFDYPLVGLAAVFAGLGQLTDQNPSFGQGLKGFGHRWGTAYADQAMGNLFTEGIFPALLHEDPRYFRRGTGSVGGRIGYALSRIMVTA